MTPNQKEFLRFSIADLKQLVDRFKQRNDDKRELAAMSPAGPCDAIDAAVTQQQQTVDAAADALLLEQLTLMLLQMQQMMCHSQNA